MDLHFLYDNSAIKLPVSYKPKNSWFEWFHLRRRKANSEEEINEFHELISNVYELMDDQARAVLLSLSKIVQDEDNSVTIEEKIKAIVAIGHSLCCGHIQIKNSIQLYSKLLVRAFTHKDLRMRLAAIIAISEASIDNLSFQMQLNEINMIPKLFETMKNSLANAGRTVVDINIHSKLVAWSCYAIVNICANCMPNILLLKEIVQTEVDTLKQAIQLDIWRHVWRENYALTILQFADDDDDAITSDFISNDIQQKSDLSENRDDQIEHSLIVSSPVHNQASSKQRCTIL